MKKGMNFSFAGVNSGVRNANQAPQLIATSTQGGFRTTPIVSSILGLNAGDYVHFISNVDSITQAIIEKNEELVNFCEENGLDITSKEAATMIHKEFDMWAITKGIPEKDGKGNYKTTTERLTKKDKLTFVTQNFESVKEQALNSGNEELVAAITVEGISTEEVAEILAMAVEPKEITKIKGAKTANSAGMTGSGVSLNFTDSKVHYTLKADLGENIDSYNRVFELSEEAIEVVINDGYADVAVKALLLGEYVDKAPSRVGGKSEEVSE